MPRKPREEEAGAIHHVFARGVDRAVIFVDELDYERYTRLLIVTVKREGWLCLSYCLMPNHVHLLVETPEPNLGTGMQWLQSQYARWFNNRHPRIGPLYQGRYGSERIKTYGHFLTVVPYIALNPVDARLCRSPDDWPWASHPLIAATPAWLAHERLLDRLEDMTGSRCYDTLVAAALRAIDTNPA